MIPDPGSRPIAADALCKIEPEDAVEVDAAPLSRHRRMTEPARVSA